MLSIFLLNAIYSDSNNIQTWLDNIGDNKNYFTKKVQNVKHNTLCGEGEGEEKFTQIIASICFHLNDQYIANANIKEFIYTDQKMHRMFYN